MSGCGSMPDAHTLLHSKSLYQENSSFAGPRGPLTEEQGQEIMERVKAHQKTPTDILERHLAFEQALSDAPLVVGNQVTLLKNGGETYRAMLEAIRGATDSINIEMYIFSDGPVGQMFADALIERQSHGVQVNLAYDSVGSLGSESFLEQLRQSGIAVLEYRPVNPFSARFLWTLSHRNHRKMLIVDGRVAFTGGINISEVYASRPGSQEKGEPPQYWRDTDIRLAGPVVAEVQRLFITEWNYQQGPSLGSRDYFPELKKEGNEIVRIIGSVPQRFSLIYVTLISAIVNSETNVFITDAYFAPDHQMLHALEHAARRGVDVRLLLPSQSDVPLIVSAERSHYQALLEAGVKIYEWQGKMLHAKTATIDGVWSTVGTSNLDWWSIARDNEINAIILSHTFGDEMNLMFKNDIENSAEIVPSQWEQRGILERVEETAARIAEPLL
jgi:cardiolipin synthase